MIIFKSVEERKKKFFMHWFCCFQTDTSGNYKRALLELIRQRIEPINRDVGSRYSNEQIVRNHSSVQWREPILRVSSDITIQRPFVRSASDRTVNRRSQDNDDNQSFIHSFHGQFDSNNQAKSNSLSTINSKRTRTNQRSFIPMSTTEENHLS